MDPVDDLFYYLGMQANRPANPLICQISDNPRVFALCLGLTHREVRSEEEDEMNRKLLTCGFYVVKPSRQLKPLSTGADLYLFLKKEEALYFLQLRSVFK